MKRLTLKSPQTKESKGTGRDPATGRLLKGHSLAKGPRRSRYAEYREAAQKAVSPDELAKLFKKFYKLAMSAGDIQAAKFVASYVAGKPTQQITMTTSPDEHDPDERYL